jgi:hypothetical protein
LVTSGLGGGGKGMRAVGKNLLKHGMELVKNLLLLGMMECILKKLIEASSYRNSGYWGFIRKSMSPF